jgi:hypothetical protein
MSAVVKESAMRLRRRSSWEAADMGILLWQKNWLPILCFFGIPFGIFYLGAAFLPEDSMTLAMIALWWLKPFFARFALHVVSIRFFEPAAPAAKLFKGLGKTLRRGIVGDLLWRRFSPFRSARMPIIVLEGLKRKERKLRRAALTPRGLDFGFPITLILMGLNFILIAGELTFVYGIFDLIQPGFLGDFWSSIGELSRLNLALSWFNEIFIETLFVCMGFGLYINARVETEGWDIELLFKKYAAEKQTKPAGLRPAAPAARDSAALAARGTATAIALCLLLFVVPSLVHAQTDERNAPIEEEFIIPPASPENKAILDKVFESSDFGIENPSKKVQFKKKEKAENTSDSNFDFEWRDFDMPWLKEAVGIGLRTFLILAIIVVLGFSARYLYRRRGFPAKKDRLSTAYVTGIEAGDPRLLLEQAAAFHKEGKIREAWAYCFRAFTAAFTKRWGLLFPAESTEYEVLRLSGGKGGDGFKRFVSLWVHFAYGGKDPASGHFEEALESCRQILEPPREKDGQ